MMQQQIPPQEQYVNQHQHQQQMAQPIMLCPIQYVYETPMIVPQAQDQQIQQNQTVVFNVQNPPPWIQNRPQPQNQVVYVQQVPSNYQPYIHPSMMQNQIYHPQFNYQLQQTMMAQDNRQFVQIPNIAHYNTVQSHITQPVQQQIKVEEPNEKMPLLTQMLTQKGVANNVRPTNVNVNDAGGTNAQNIITSHLNSPTNNVNNVRPTNIHNTSVPVNMIRPITQNQQVQTDISANNKVRPRSGQPQVITINPMQQQQYMPLNHKPDVIFNISRPQAPYMRPEMPQHIRSKIPNSISVKTVYKPILPRPMRPLDVMQGPQNFYYNQNVAHVPNSEMRNSAMNTDSSLVKQNVNLQGTRNQIQTDSANNLPTLQKDSTINMPDIDRRTVQKQTADASVNVNEKLNPVIVFNEETISERNLQPNIESKTQPEEKLVRNTVFTQARGLIINDKDIVKSHSPKRTIHERLKEERLANTSGNYEDPMRSSNKYIKVEVTESTSMIQLHHGSVESLATPAKVNCETKFNVPKILSTHKSGVLPVAETSQPINEKPLLPNPEKDMNTHLEKNSTTRSDNVPTVKAKDNATKDAFMKEKSCMNNNSIPKTESMFKNRKRNANEVNVLTHVLDGYIIQESNVAFPIQKPVMENVRGAHSQDNLSEEAENKTVKADPTIKKTIEAKHTDDVMPHLPLRYLNKDIETEEEMEFAVVNKDDPFTNIQKSAVQSWTTDELTAHLAKYEWKETASKLGEEEIDGESLLLVNKEQLLAIGVCEQHAEVISAFAGAS